MRVGSSDLPDAPHLMQQQTFTAQAATVVQHHRLALPWIVISWPTRPSKSGPHRLRLSKQPPDREGHFDVAHLHQHADQLQGVS